MQVSEWARNLCVSTINLIELLLFVTSEYHNLLVKWYYLENLMIYFCRCSGNYYGTQCELDGEVLGVAIGASVAAVVIIGLTLVCLLMWR